MLWRLQTFSTCLWHVEGLSVSQSVGLLNWQGLFDCSETLKHKYHQNDDSNEVHSFSQAEPEKGVGAGGWR